MVLLHLLYISTFTFSATSAAAVLPKSIHYTEESPTKTDTRLKKESSLKFTECGNKFSYRTPRILNGRNATIGEFPWMASIQFGNPSSNHSHHCGGSIIGPKHILTAAHCFLDEDKNKDAIVVLGAIYQSKPEDGDDWPVQILKVKTIIKHENFSTGPAQNDIAILIVEDNIKWSINKQMICLPSEKFLHGNVNAKAAGWGQTFGGTPFYLYVNTEQSKEANKLSGNLSPDDYNAVSPVLKAINLTIFNNTECKQKWYDGRYNVEYGINNTKICAGSSSLTGSEIAGDTQSGDSGGPLMVLEGGRWIVAGITSVTYKLPDPVPGIYTRVSEFLPWIYKHLLED